MLRPCTGMSDTVHPMVVWFDAPPAKQANEAGGPGDPPLRLSLRAIAPTPVSSFTANLCLACCFVSLTALPCLCSYVPFVTMNWVLGATPVPFVRYFAATAIGIVPGTALYDMPACSCGCCCPAHTFTHTHALATDTWCVTCPCVFIQLLLCGQGHPFATGLCVGRNAPNTLVKDTLTVASTQYISSCLSYRNTLKAKSP